MCFHVEVQRAPPVNSQVNSNTRVTSYVYLIGTCVSVEEVVSSLKPNDLIVTMSNGSFDGLSDSLFKALSNA